jgi:hypothetical protein
LFENPSAIHLKGNEDAKSPSSHEEATHETENEAPTVHPDGQTSKSEPQATGVGNSRSTFVQSPYWLPKGWHTEIRDRERQECRKQR